MSGLSQAFMLGTPDFQRFRSGLCLAFGGSLHVSAFDRCVCLTNVRRRTKREAKMKINESTYVIWASVESHALFHVSPEPLNVY